MKLYRVTSNTASVAHGKRKNTQEGMGKRIGGRELAAGGMRRAKCQSHSQSSSSSWTGAGAAAGRGNWTAEQTRDEQGEWEERVV